MYRNLCTRNIEYKIIIIIFKTASQEMQERKGNTKGNCVWARSAIEKDGGGKKLPAMTLLFFFVNVKHSDLVFVASMRGIKDYEDLLALWKYQTRRFEIELTSTPSVSKSSGGARVCLFLGQPQRFHHRVGIQKKQTNPCSTFQRSEIRWRSTQTAERSWEENWNWATTGLHKC